MTSLRRPLLSLHGTMMARLPPLSPACTAATASSHTPRRDSGREATKPGDRSAPRLPRMTTLSAFNAAVASAAKSTGETASHSSFVAGMSTAAITFAASFVARGTMGDATRRFGANARRAVIARVAAPVGAARGADANARHEDVAIAMPVHFAHRTRLNSIAVVMWARRQVAPRWRPAGLTILYSWTIRSPQRAGFVAGREVRDKASLQRSAARPPTRRRTANEPVRALHRTFD